MRAWGTTPLLLLAALLLPNQAQEVADPWLLRPERTGWTETSRNHEVMELLQKAAAAHPRIHLTSFGYTTEGNQLPLLVVGSEAMPDTKRTREKDLLRIYLQANIHAGEVAGKEALLRLVRDLAQGKYEGWTRDWILLIAPNYNPDGNDRIHLRNRLRQHGPTGGMGTRENAQGLDLNRDQMKLDAPEARALARLITEWDPHLILDLHTTNGTHHGYHLTYAPPLHPATPVDIDQWLRHELLPALDETMERHWGWKTFHYGNRFQRGKVDGWWTFDCRPRFVTNYAGVRQRAAILVEAYAYLTFENRVLATERFLHALFDYLVPRRKETKHLIEEATIADFSGRLIPLRGELPPHPPEQDILIGEVISEPHPAYDDPPLFRRGPHAEYVLLPTATHFDPAGWQQLPEAYYITPKALSLKSRLEAHGIIVTPIETADHQPVEQFQVHEVQALRVFQERELQQLEGQWQKCTLHLDPDGFLVPMDQPLGLLAALLLEPQSDDGFAHWGFLSEVITPGTGYPVWRILPDSNAQPQGE